MTEDGNFRYIDCAECGGTVKILLRATLKDCPDDKCLDCGVRFGNAKEARDYAQDRLGNLEKARTIAKRWTYDQVMDIAERAYAEPSSVSAKELDALAAFTLLRDAGEYAHAQDRAL